MKQLFRNQKRLLYNLCFFLLCIVDQRKGSVTGSMQYFWSNCTGFVIALIIFSHYHIKDFMKKHYILWAVIGILGFMAVNVFLEVTGFRMPWETIQWYSAFANIFIYGFLVIQTISTLLRKPPNKRKLLFRGLLCLMLILMGISRNDSVWPWYFLLVFGTLVFTDFVREERQRIFWALVDGILLGFLCIQGLAFIFRPYDEIRYLGMYANPNINALFYSIVYCAVLIRLLYFLLEYRGKFQKILVFLAMFWAGAMWSFCVLTGCRTALLSMGMVTCAAGIFCLLRFRGKVIVKGTGLIIGLVLCILSSFPVVFFCVRYIPAYFHHPIWFYAEYSQEKIHSWDPIDSEKYIDFHEVKEYVWDRFFGIETVGQKTGALLENKPRFSLLCSTSEEICVEEVMPLISNTEDSGVIRFQIYKHYLSKLNLAGHLNAENGLHVTYDYFAPHAHNMYLQMAFNFGIPIGICFLIFVVGNLVGLWRRVIVGSSADVGRSSFLITPSLGYLLFFLNSTTFGLLEMMWQNGYLAFTILFLTSALLMSDSDKGC